MNWDHMALRKRWGKLTDEDLRRINGKREQLSKVLSERYALARDQAEEQIKEFEQTEEAEEVSKS
jgi:uncharacterized protein YjbJ (UPF0337 family)